MTHRIAFIAVALSLTFFTHAFQAEPVVPLGARGDGLDLLGQGGPGLGVVAYDVDDLGVMRLIVRNNTDKTVDWADGGVVIYDKQGKLAAASDGFYPQFPPLAPHALGVADAYFTGVTLPPIGRVEARVALVHDGQARKMPLSMPYVTRTAQGLTGFVANDGPQTAHYPIMVTGGCVSDTGALLVADTDVPLRAATVLQRGDTVPFTLDLTGDCPHAVVFASGGV